MPFPNNITQFKNGEVANPKGGPKGSLNRTTLYRRFLDLEGQYVNPLTQVFLLVLKPLWNQYIYE